MARKLSQDDFIKRAKDVHGDKYDYSKVKYTNTKTHVIIICPEHGEFQQKPEKHMSGQGCPLCSNAKLEETNLKRYGVRRPLQSKEIHERMEQTCTERYNASNPTSCPAVMEKVRNTCQERYGTDYAVQAESVRERKEQTLRQKYGGNSPFSSEEIREKAHQTIQERYGTDNVVYDPEIHKRMQQTCIERYGSKSPLSNPEVQQKKLQTMNERYGGNSPFVSEEIREKSIYTSMIKYGVSNPMQVSEIQQKVLDAKRENNTFHTSEPEDILYNYLCDIFGQDNVERQFMSDVYPFPCDFYIKSRDMYIELNGTWTHGRNWFDNTCYEDCQILSEWKCKAIESNYYANAVHVWSERDVMKRECAKQNNLNYIVFWDNKLRDFELWSAEGCPDGHDWDRMYSWISERNIHGISCSDELTGTRRNLSLAAKAYQFSVFYEHEIDLWRQNKLYHELPLQMYLYYNRWCYKKKLPEQLSDLELMNGFTISGIHKGYTVFDTELMDIVIKKYNIKSVYDPCAGWGERMLYCYCNDIDYFGVDINEKLQNGYERMMKDFHMEKQSFVHENSSIYVPAGKADAVVTCPPYGNTEIYSEYGAENLSKTDFLNWWKSVVKNTTDVNPEYFCFQINQKWYDDMTRIVEECGFAFVEKFEFTNKQSSHFTRKNGVNIKKEYESMVVLKRKNMN